MGTHRKHARAVVHIKARYRSPTIFRFVEDECYDLSQGGMFMATASPADAGTLIRFECDVHESDGFSGVGRVVWKRNTSQGEDKPSGMAVKFVRLDPGATEIIEQLVQASEPEGGHGPEARGSLPPSSAEPETTADGAPAAAATGATGAATPESAPAAGDSAEASVSAEASQTATSLEASAAGSVTAAKPASKQQGRSKKQRKKQGKKKKERKAATASASGSASPSSRSAPAQSEAGPSATPGAASRGVQPETTGTATKSGWFVPAALIAVLGATIWWLGGPQTGPESPSQPVAVRSPAASPSAGLAVPSPDAKEATKPPSPTVPSADTAIVAAVSPDASTPGASSDTEAAPSAAEPANEPTPSDVVKRAPDPALPDAVDDAVAEDPGAKAVDDDAVAEDQGAKAVDDDAVAEDQGANAAQETEHADAPYHLHVITTPPGAQVTAGKESITAPGWFRHTSFSAPVKVYASKPGYKPTAAIVDAERFTLEEGVRQGRIYLRLREETQ